MSMLEIYKGDNKRIDLTFTTDSGTPFNLSGQSLYYIVQQNYTDTGALFSIVQTQHDLPVSGFTHIDISTGDSNQCAGDYLALFRLIDESGRRTTFETEGLKILPSF